MKYVIMATGRCTNACGICAMQRKPAPGFDHFCTTETEREAARRLIIACDEDTICVTGGGDPLQNVDFLRIVATYAKGEKHAILNPLSFLSLQAGKPGQRLTPREYEQTMHGELSRPLELIVSTLKSFDLLQISSGSYQAPDDQTYCRAKRFFRKRIKPLLKEEVKIKRNCAKSLKNVRYAPWALKTFTPLWKTPSLEESERRETHCKNPSRILYFSREGNDARLMMPLCCSAAMTEYLSHPSGLLASEMATMDPANLRARIEQEVGARDKSAYVRLLDYYRRPDTKTLETVGSVFEERARGTLTKKFKLYARAAAALLKEKGVSDDPLARAYTKGTNYCAHCIAIGGALHRAGVDRDEWHAYLNKTFTFPDR